MCNLQDFEDYDDDDEDNIYDDYCRDFINMVDNQIKGMKNLINYNCLESSLKLVEVKDFVGSKNGLVFLCYLIRYGKVLKNVSINVLKTELEGSSNVAFYSAIEEYLMTTPRASSNLQISICYWVVRECIVKMLLNNLFPMHIWSLRSYALTCFEKS